jgi:hypothetical protein
MEWDLDAPVLEGGRGSCEGQKDPRNVNSRKAS